MACTSWHNTDPAFLKAQAKAWEHWLKKTPEGQEFQRALTRIFVNLRPVGHGDRRSELCDKDG